MAMGFQKAKREKIWVKVLLGGASGSGKTYSALKLAVGMSKQCGGAGVAAIDTENGRIRYYADEFDFCDLQLSTPYTPEKYIEAIDTAVNSGFKVLIIDSLTHEWDYCVEVHNKMPGNSYTNWGKVTPRHDAFMEKILQSPIHILATVRGKDDYAQEQKDGKTIVKKIGIGYKQRDNVEYNYTVTFNIDQETHIATVMKDNTHLFEGRYDMLTEKDGENLYLWANSGDTPQQKTEVPKMMDMIEDDTSDGQDLKGTITQIINVSKEKISSGIDASEMYDIIKKHHTSKNLNSIKDIKIAQTILKEIVDYKGDK